MKKIIKWLDKTFDISFLLIFVSVPCSIGVFLYLCAYIVSVADPSYFSSEFSPLDAFYFGNFTASLLFISVAVLVSIVRFFRKNLRQEPDKNITSKGEN